MMISKERFIEILKFIQNQESKQDKFIEALELLSPGSYVDAFIYSEYAQVLIDILSEMFNDENGDIEYFLYELDAINNENLTIPSDLCPYYNSPDTLYDYLVNNIGEKND